MPGLCGIIDSVADARGRTEAMVAYQRRYDWHHGTVEAFDGGAFGHVRVDGPTAPRPLGFATAGHLRVVFDGELYGAERLPGSTDAERLAGLLTRDGRRGLATVHGCFTAAIWDARARTVTLATDRFAMRPLFWSEHGGRFAFGSEAGALLAGGVPADRSTRGLAEFLAFGQFLGDTTLFAHVRAAPAAAWIVYDERARRVSVESYVDRPQAPRFGSDAEWLDAIDEAFAASVDQCCHGGGRLGLSLSGGLDARTILGVAPDRARLQCVCLGIPGSIDVRAAEEMAHIAGQPFQAHHLDGDFLARFEPLLREMVRLTDGQYLDQGIVLTTLQDYRALGIDTLLRGHAGELMHMSKAYAFSMDSAAAGLRTKAELSDWLWRHLTNYMIGGVDEACFSGRSGARLKDEARASLEERMAAVDDVEPVPQRIWHLFVQERQRRETALSLQMFRSFAEVRLPYLEPRLVDLLLAAPVHLKLGDTIQSHILRRRRPEFLDVVNANTGAPMGASQARAQLGTLRMRVLAKLGVKGYQPYERLGLWLATSLQPLLKAMLLGSPEGVGAFDRQALSSLIEQHAARERNHTFLLMALLILGVGTPASRQPALRET